MSNNTTVLNMVKKAQVNHILGNREMVSMILEELRILLEGLEK
jgi:hypothetical protein